MKKTNAIRQLEKQRIPFTLHEYPVDVEGLDASSVAAFLGVAPERLFKTLVATAEPNQPGVFCIPGSSELDLKRAAAAMGAKRVAMLPQRGLEPLTGYIHGGCSPLGMKQALPTWVDESALRYRTILVSAGRRGLQVELDPRVLLLQADAQTAYLTAEFSQVRTRIRPDGSTG